MPIAERTLQGVGAPTRIPNVRQTLAPKRRQWGHPQGPDRQCGRLDSSRISSQGYPASYPASFASRGVVLRKVELPAPPGVATTRAIGGSSQTELPDLRRSCRNFILCEVELSSCHTAHR